MENKIPYSDKNHLGFTYTYCNPGSWAYIQDDCMQIYKIEETIYENAKK